MSDTTQTQDHWATAPVDAGAAPANDATANAGDARSSAPPPAAHDAAASGADWLSGARRSRSTSACSIRSTKHGCRSMQVTQGIDWLVLHFRPLFGVSACRWT